MSADFMSAGFEVFVPLLVTGVALYWALRPKPVESPIGYGALGPTLHLTGSIAVSALAWAIYLAAQAV